MSPLAPSFEQRVLEGFATVLAANPDATVPLAYSVDPEYVFTAGQVAIVLDTWPESTGGIVEITDYTVTDDPSLSNSVIGVQVTIWHKDRLTVKAIAADVFNLIHGRARGMLGTITLVSALRTSGTSLGQDSNERQGRVENYYLGVYRPSTNRL